MSFLHGLKLIENNDGGQVLPLQMSSVYGIVGTAEPYAAGSSTTADEIAALEAAFPLNTPVLVSKASDLATMADDSYLKRAVEMAWAEQKTYTVVVRTAGKSTETTGEGNSAVTTTVYAAANVPGTALAGTGIYALKKAKSAVGYAPSLIFAEFPDEDGNSAKETNWTAIKAALKAVADSLMGIAIIPEAAEPSSAFNDSKCAYRVYGKVKVAQGANIVSVDPCPVVAGLIAAVDYNDGQWVSPSNHTFKSVVGVDPALEFDMMDESSQVNTINNYNVACVVNEGGYRLWGNNTSASTTDQKWQFLCVKRTSDLIKKTIKEGILWAIDKGIRKNFVDDVTTSVNGVLNELITRGAILGGECWAEVEDNSVNSVKQGIVHFKYKFGPVYPAQTLIFEEVITDEYIAEIFN